MMLGQPASSGAAGAAASDMTGAASSNLDRLSAGAFRWIRANMEFFDPASATELPPTPRAQAILELALLRLVWARYRPEDDGLGEVTAFVREIWQRPDFSRLVTAHPSYAQRYGLIYGALAPAGIAGGSHRAILTKLAADGYLTPHGKSPYLRLETRYYADLAGVGHEFESYAELCASGILAKLEAPLAITENDAYEITHTIFYLSDFGGSDAALAHDDRERVHRMVCLLTDLFAQRNHWDLVGELLLAQGCLGKDPVHTPSGLAGIQRLQEIQLPNGAISGSSIEPSAGASATTVEFFRKAYHTTLVTALITLTASAARGKAALGG
jgi:hypothetical protein